MSLVSVMAALWLRWIEGWYVLSAEQMDRMQPKPQPKPTVQTKTHQVVLRTETPSAVAVVLPERRKSADLLQFIRRQRESA